ncbi:MAG TPA: protein kinase [Polyangiaceae bacterium]
MEKIGHGGMAIVYRARDKRLGRDVAVKIIHGHLRENKEVAARFVSEARAVAKVKHPNIVEVYDVSDVSDPERYLVQELVRGTTLRALIQEHGFLPAEVAASIAIEVANALDHAHGLGVIHRDIKPENVLIELPKEPLGSEASAESIRAARVKITDFGIAKLLDAQGVTSTGQVLGSPAHMAPEQIEGGEVSGRSDVFGLGVLLYEALVGKLPFDGKNPAQVLRRVLDGVFTPADRARPTVGIGLTEILNKALAREASARYESARAFADALGAELALVDFGEPRAEIFEFLRAPTAYRERYESRVVAALARRAESARDQGDHLAAAALFNRALAFRPGDPELLEQVGNLARRARLRRTFTRVSAGALGSLTLAGLAFAGVALLRARHAERASLPRPTAPAEAAHSALGTAVTAPVTAAVASDSKPVAVGADAARHLGHVKAAPSQPAPAETANVRVLVDGPKNATVKVDGREVEWFGPPLTMSVGTHVFEFVPPNEECCVAGQTLSINVNSPNAAGDAQLVRGTIEFKPAILDLRGPPGSTASCGELGSFSVPSVQKIRMVGAAINAHCTLIAPASSGLLPKEFDVSLSPGRLFTAPGS